MAYSGQTGVQTADKQIRPMIQVSVESRRYRTFEDFDAVTAAAN